MCEERRSDASDDDLEEPLHARRNGAASSFYALREDLAADVPGDGAEGNAEGEGEDVDH